MNKVKTNSFITLSRELVQSMCEETITNIEEERKRRDHERVLENQKRLNNGLFHKLAKKWFKVKDFTYEESINEIESRDWSVMYYPSDYAWGDLERAKKLLKMCEQEVEEILVCSEDYRAIS